MQTVSDLFASPWTDYWYKHILGLVHLDGELVRVK